VAALVPDMFCSFNLEKNHRNADNSTTTKATEKISTHFGIFRILDILYVCLTEFKNNQILIDKISHGVLVTTKLFSG
jgi:hypothetical protein